MVEGLKQLTYPLVLYCLPLIIGTVLSSWANIHIKLDSIHKPMRGGRNPLTARKYLIFGIILSILGALLDLSVVSTVPITIRAGLASLSIPISVILAKMILDEHLSSAQAFGVTLAILGPFVSVIYASHETAGKPHDDWRFAVNSVKFKWFFAVSIPAFLVAFHRLKFGTFNRAANLISLLLSAFTCAFSASVSNACARFLVYAISHSGFKAADSLVLLFLTIGVSVFQIFCMSTFLSLFDASVALPMYQVLNSLILSIVGIIVFDETIESIAGYVGGMSVAFLGLWVITTQSRSRERKCDEPLLDLSVEETDYDSVTKHAINN